MFVKDKILLNNVIQEHRDLFFSFFSAAGEGIVLWEKETGKIIAYNMKAGSLLDLPGESDDAADIYIFDIFDDDDMEKLLAGSIVYEQITDTPFQANAVSDDSYGLITAVEYEKAEQENTRNLESLVMNAEIKNLFKTNQDSGDIVITNGKGIIEFAGESMDYIKDTNNSYIVGRSVYDLERENYFSPSVTIKVLETKQRQVVFQKTKYDKYYVTIGVPLFSEDNEDEIDKVVSFNIDYDAKMKESIAIAGVDRLGLLQETSGDDHFADEIVTCSEKMLSIKTLVRMIADINSTVLITGETGTGKEKIAQSICRLSRRRNAPFITVNCGSIPHSIVESELYGYDPASFTGASREGKIGLIEAAHTGILFLDEISELPLEQQVKLLHVLQERKLTRVGGVKEIPLDMRVIAASNKDLKEEVEKGNFREDLYYRLNIVPIHLPPLRERKEDIPLLIKYFINKFNAMHSKHKQISKRAVNTLTMYEWPGNIRQLENTVEYLVVTAKGPLIDEEAIPEEIRPLKTTSPSSHIYVNKLITLEEAVCSTEIQLISMALQKYGTVRKAAEVLGVNQSTISRKMTQYNIKKSKDVNLIVKSD